MKYFGTPSNGDRLHLQILGTHFDYLRRGFATKLVNWGISMAERDTLRLSLFASPMGFLLYTKLGFRDCGEVIVQVEGEEEKIVMHAMEYNPDGKEEVEEVTEL